jgi:hypothetical protein
VFAVFNKLTKGQKRLYQVLRVGSIEIRRHRKIIAEANPYLPKWAKYFWTRRHDKESKLLAGLSSRALAAA